MHFAFESTTPDLDETTFIAPGAIVLGNVQCGEHSSIWYNSVVRGDAEFIRIGAYTNIQDLSVIHITTGLSGTTIGAHVTVGHRAIIHGCTIEDHCLIGMGATVMDGAVIGHHSIVGAGAVVTPGKVIPPYSMVLGAPGRVTRETREHEHQMIAISAQHYAELAQRHMRNLEALKHD